MKEILLTRGFVAIVDDEDYGELSSVSWCFNGQYATRTIAHPTGPQRQTQERMHRRILGLQFGDKRQGDHINGNKLDNRRINLRVCNFSQNRQNVAIYSNNESGFKGVSEFRPGRWQASIRVSGKHKNLGVYRTPEEAHEVWCLWADMLYGEFANHGEWRDVQLV